MTPRRSVYILTSRVDDPAYEGFASTETRPNSPARLTHDAIQEFDRTCKQWKVRPLAADWKPVRVIGRVRKFNDYPTVSGVPAFSDRAVEALRDLLEPNGELLPLISDVGTYFAYNILRVVNALDHARSDISWALKPVGVSSVERYEFHPDRLGAAIFVLPEASWTTLVTDQFVRRVQEHKLKGFCFDRIWPLPPGVLWWQLRKKRWRAEEREGLRAGRTIKGNTVVIRLYLEDSSADKPTPAERQRIAGLEDELDAILVDVNSTAPAFGSLEGRDEVKGEARLFLTCPDADALVEHLRPWLTKLNWPAGFRVLKRYGEFVDREAPEQYVEDL